MSNPKGRSVIVKRVVPDVGLPSHPDDLDKVVHSEDLVGEDGVIDPADLDELFHDGLGG